MAAPSLEWAFVYFFSPASNPIRPSFVLLCAAILICFALPSVRMVLCCSFDQSYSRLLPLRARFESKRVMKNQDDNCATGTKQWMQNTSSLSRNSTASVSGANHTHTTIHRPSLYSLLRLYLQFPQLNCCEFTSQCFPVQHQLRAVALSPPPHCGAQGSLTEINECVTPQTNQVAARDRQRSELTDQEQ